MSFYDPDMLYSCLHCRPVDRQKIVTDGDRDGRVEQHDIVLSQVRVVRLFFVSDNGTNVHAVTVHHVSMVGRERDQDGDGQSFNRQCTGHLKTALDYWFNFCLQGASTFAQNPDTCAQWRNHLSQAAASPPSPPPGCRWLWSHCTSWLGHWCWWTVAWEHCSYCGALALGSHPSHLLVWTPAASNHDTNGVRLASFNSWTQNSRVKHWSITLLSLPSPQLSLTESEWSVNV